MSRLITASLIGSIDWLNKCPTSWKVRAAEDLKRQLAREYSDETPFNMQRGIDFENAVYKAALAKKIIKGSEHFKWFAMKVRGGVFQKKCKRFIDIDGHEYCLYGKIDAWFKDRIIDIKTTSRYGGKNKYLDSFQHKLYCYIERIPDFTYLIAEFDGDTNTIIDRYDIDYSVTNWEALKDDVIGTVREAIAFLGQHGELFDLYNTTFSRY